MYVSGGVSESPCQTVQMLVGSFRRITIETHLEVFAFHDVDREPGDGGVEADGEQYLGQIGFARLDVLFQVGRQVLQEVQAVQQDPPFGSLTKCEA